MTRARQIPEPRVNIAIMRVSNVFAQTIPGTGYVITQVLFTAAEGGNVYKDTDGSDQDITLNSRSCIDLENSRIVIPHYANWVRPCGKVEFNQQSNGDGVFGIHLWRNGAATTQDMFLHNKFAYPANAGTSISGQAGPVGWMPAYGVTGLSAYNPLTTYSVGQTVSDGGINYYSIQNSNTGNTPATSPSYWKPYKETWDLRVAQNTGGDAGLYRGGKAVWLSVEWRR